VMHHAIQQIAIVSLPDQVVLEILASKTASPNMDAVQHGVTEVEKILSEGSVSRFELKISLPTYATVEFAPTEIPGIGYRVYGIRPSSKEPALPIEDEGRRIENRFLRVDVESDGTLTVLDRCHGVAYQHLLRFRDQADRGDSYTFCPVEGDIPIESFEESPITVKRRIDSCTQTLDIQLSMRVPEGLIEERSARSDILVLLPIHVLVRLISDVPRIDLKVGLDNPACDHRLQALFPSNHPVSSAYYGGHYEIVRRSTALPECSPDWAEQPTPENPMRNFVAISAGNVGLMIASKGLYEASVSPDGIIAITLLRCFGWLSRNDLATRKSGAGPQLPTPNGQSPGPHTFDLSIIPFKDDLISATPLAESFQKELRAISTKLHSGSLPQKASLLSIQPNAFALTALKNAVDDQGLILRGVNLSERPQNVEIHSLLPLQSVSRTALDETHLEDLPIHDGSRIRIPVKPHEILTLRIRPEPFHNRR
jgi:alpha-mannosidase